MLELDPLEMPLRGRRLIEASAGTGKTHAIGSLVLRTLLGHGRPAQRIDEILVVTFTKAATLELRGRLRQRVADALVVFEEEGDAPPEDPFLRALLDACSERDVAAAQLRAALARFDEAAVFTIHGFCQRMLVERAFDSGARFAQEFVLDDREYRQRAARDFWRRQVYPLPEGLAALVIDRWPDPDALLRDVGGWLGRFGLDVRTGQRDDFRLAAEGARSALEALARHWLDADVSTRIAASSLSKDQKFGGAPRHTAAMDTWARDCARSEDPFSAIGAEGESGSIAALLALYTREALLKKVGKRGTPPDFDETHELVDAALDALDDVHVALRAQAIREIGDALEAEKLSDARISPDDVLRGAWRGLSGRGGARFAEAVRRTYPIAFIDEFQDTDPLQYGIFDALYPPDDEGGTLVMIGDPKQAIYAFRGADVYAYLDARAILAADARAVMHTNWRSSPEMLDAVEALYRDATAPCVVNEIGFTPVVPRPGAKRGEYRDGTGSRPALTFWHLASEGGVAANGLQAASEARLVAEIQRLLAGDVTIAGAPLEARQIAVLVRTHGEAVAVFTALARVGIASVRQARETVFASDEAVDLERLLAAALDPRDEAAVRAALATPLLDLPLDRLQHDIHVDEAAWQRHLDRFAGYHELWRRHGPMVMLTRVLADYDVPARWLPRLDGPRRLTDVRHLGELLQRAASALGGMHRLLLWLGRERSAAAEAEEARMRLETDADLVRIVTMHASKGLEYDVVLVPFGTWLREANDAAYHEQADGRWRAVLDLKPDAHALAAAERERLAEDLRLLYVAMTRARRALYLGVANLSPGGRTSRLRATALGHLLLGPGDEASDAELAARLEALAGASESIRVEVLDAPELGPPTHLAVTPRLAVRTPMASVQRSGWRLTSYSALVEGTDPSSAHVRGAGDEVELVRAPVTGEAEPAPEDVAHRFPKGARPGSCLHAVLEDWPADSDAVQAHVEAVLAAWGFGDGEVDAGAVRAWMEDVRACPLPLGADLATVDRALAEMEFHLPLGGGRSEDVQALLARFGYSDAPLSLERLDGMLRGFVDLVVEHDGRFWIVDYKSNWLGNDASAYTPEALAESVREHRYDLQYLIYSVALRRLLRARLGPDGVERFGGVLYLYLRGMRSGAGIHMDVPPDALLDGLDAIFSGGEASALAGVDAS